MVTALALPISHSSAPPAARALRKRRPVKPSKGESPKPRKTPTHPLRSVSRARGAGPGVEADAPDALRRRGVLPLFVKALHFEAAKPAGGPLS